jgi:hypothetical protein
VESGIAGLDARIDHQNKEVPKVEGFENAKPAAGTSEASVRSRRFRCAPPVDKKVFSKGLAIPEPG